VTVAVSDTSPLNYLVLSRVIDTLGRTTFKIAPSLIATVLERDAQRRRTQSEGDERGRE
jgi:hypothetical protein